MTIRIRKGDGFFALDFSCNHLSSTKTEYYKQLVESIQAKTVANWLSLDRQNLVGRALSLPTPDDIGATFDEKAIVEYYSR